MSEWRNFPGWSNFGTKGRLREDLEWQKLLNELDNVEVLRGVLGCLDTRHYLMRVNFWPLQMPPALFSCRSLRKKSQQSGVGRRSFNVLTSPWCLWAGEDWIINANILDVFGDRATGWQLACQSIRILKTYNWHLFESWWLRSYDSGSWFSTDSVDREF